MGLLIGASALTLVEVLDLFLYNIIVKLSDRRHTLKSVSHNNSKEKLTKHDEARRKDFEALRDHSGQGLTPVEDGFKDPHKIQVRDKTYDQFSGFRN